MERLFKYTIITFFANLATLVIILIFAFPTKSLDEFSYILMLIIVLGLIETIIALFLITNEEKKIYGQAMLLSLGIILLTGFSWCGIVMNQ